MRFQPLGISGAALVHLEPVHDDRGFFARTWCESDFAKQGFDGRIAQCNMSLNSRRGTIRGLHLQRPPHAEAKTVRCIRGMAFDVLVDLRRKSPTYGRWESIELTSENRLSVYIPEGVAHGFQSLEDNTEIFYQMSTPYHPAAAWGVRWDDPSLGIPWPVQDPIVSSKDRALPLLGDGQC